MDLGCTSAPRRKKLQGPPQVLGPVNFPSFIFQLVNMPEDTLRSFRWRYAHSPGFAPRT